MPTVRIARLAACLAFLLTALPAAAQFEGSLDLRMTSHEEGNRMEGKGRLYLTAKAWRVEMELTAADVAKGSPGASMMGGMVGHRMVAFAKESAPGKTWVVNDRMKTYSVVEDDAEEVGSREDAAGWKVTKLGADKVAGLACTSIRAERKGEDEIHEACLTKELGTGKWMKGMQESEEEGWMLAAERIGVGGHPVRMITRDRAGKERMRFEVTKVDRKKPAASLFEVPKGYRETSLMEGFAQTPEQQAQMEEAKRQIEEAMKEMPPEQRKAIEEMMKQGGMKK